MITHIKATGFSAIPYLETSALMANHPDGISFSSEKPNVIVGPNGSGKSALLAALSLLTLSSQTGQSTFDGYYIHGWRDELWKKGPYRCEPHEYLPGLDVVTDGGAALFYRPQHIPGNDHSVAAAMMTGYFEQAKAYGLATRSKSSGQQGQVLLERIIQVLRGLGTPTFLTNQWDHGVEVPRKLAGAEDPRRHRADVLLQRLGGNEPGRMPVVLMDEPEQSLDALAEAQLWHDIENCSTAQVIVATHSIYPFTCPERFNVIEAVPGYADQVRNACYPRERE